MAVREADWVDERREMPDERFPWLSVALRGDGPCIAEARHAAARFLASVHGEHGEPIPPPAVDLTCLIVSELVTNALKYAPGPVLMDVRIRGGVVEVVVRDSDPVFPVAGAADAGRVGQHGLEIVVSVAQSFEVREDPFGKRVIARVALSDGADGAGRPGRRGLVAV
ncbi:ATP-binding protein [Streptomyces sp. NPDC006704]|uniref:ATP-binding protein n=1 Tax=Streptomyces sp. NPDC006704 TaxID=3364760 RepID=UPI0036BD0F65